MWMDLLSEFDFEIKHMKGNENMVADALSISMKLVHLEVISSSESDIKERVKTAQETYAFFKSVTLYIKKEPRGIKYEGSQMLDDDLFTYKDIYWRGS
jgi:hypothetical protein